MKKGGARERPTLDLMEEAVHLLRSTPLHVFGWYLLGVLPFLLGLLYFWMDMSRSALAHEHRAEASLGVALLFVWMKSGQSIFTAKLRDRVAGEAERRTSVSQFVRVALCQAIVQPSKLFLLPIAALVAIPFGWIWAFYENATVLGEGKSVREFFSRSWRLACFAPRQNHYAISTYLLLLFVIFLNVAIVVLLLPQLLKMFTGIETIFTRSQASLFNTTFFAIIAALTYLICDPLLKAIYTLRCFHGESLRSGADLTAEMRALPRLKPAVAVLIAVCLLAASPGVAAPASAPTPLEMRASELNRSIDETVKRAEFTWKLPRQQENARPQRKWPFVDAIGRFLKATGKAVKRVLNLIGDWFERQFAGRNPSPDRSSSGGWHASSRVWMIALLVLLVGAALALLAQTLRQLRLRRSAPAAATPAAPKVDLEDESLTADLLPEDEWLGLARDHLARGEVRLALRAFFFAGLAHLSTRNVLVLARHKSNRDYQAELRRKASDRPSLLEAFGQNILAVERVWYGQHEIDREGVQQFENNLEQIRAC